MTKALPRKGVTDLTNYQRALGRLIELDNQTGQAQLNPLLGEASNDLLADAFWNLYLPQPELVEDDKVPANRDLNKMLLEWVSKTHGWETTRIATRASLLTSVMTAPLLYSQLASDETIAELLQKQKEVEELQQAADKENDKADDATDPDEKAARQKNAQKLQDKADKKSQDLSDMAAKLTDDKSKLGNAIKAKVAKKVSEQAKENRELVESMGYGDEAGEGGEVDIDKVKEILANRNTGFSEKVREITKKAGRLKGVALQCKESSRRSVIATVDGMTQDMPNIFPGELYLLRPDVNPIIRAQKMGEYADRGLLGMIKSSETIQEGNLIIAVDGSSSMEGDAEIQAKAIAIAMAEAAKENGQEFEMFTFSSGHYRYAQDPNKPGDFYECNSNDSMPKIMRWAEKMQNGGTDFNDVFKFALSKLEAMGDKAMNTDFIIITDGESDIDDDVNKAVVKAKKMWGTRIISLQIGDQRMCRKLLNLSTATAKMSHNPSQQEIDNLIETLTTASARE